MRFMNQFVYSIVLAVLSIVVTDVDIAQGLSDDSRKQMTVHSVKYE
ncbi:MULTISPECIES: hypothetical protein [unclassified Methylocaldum]|jgi:hypothetical protein|nr:hypothetical protein [Methylocaldum sp. RMAD-M]MBP1151809.1 hypothetical protein [Methylocaldum sp. RMAD-M]